MAWTKFSRYRAWRNTVTFFRSPDVPGFCPEKGVLGTLITLIVMSCLVAN
jgi:hypothetical protein